MFNQILSIYHGLHLLTLFLACWLFGRDQKSVWMKTGRNEDFSSTKLRQSCTTRISVLQVQSSPDCHRKRVNSTESVVYSGDLKFDHFKSGNIWKPDFVKVGFQKVRFSIGRALAMAIASVPTVQNPDVFIRILNGFWQNGTHLLFQIVGLPDFRSHSKSRPFETKPLFDHSNLD